MRLGKATTAATTATSVSSASSQEDGGDISDEGPDLGVPEYWNELVVEVAKESQAGRASTLQGIHDEVLQALGQPHVETWVKRIYRQAAFDATAAGDSPSDFNRKEQEFAAYTSKALELLRMQGQGRASAYGGAIGNVIFQKLTNSVVVPTLSTLIARFADDTEPFSDADARECLEVFLPAFLDEAGRNRMLIATMTGSDDAAEFGVRAPFGASMADRVGEQPDWARWNSLVVGKIHQITAQSGSADHVHGSELWPRGGHPWAHVSEAQLQVSMSGGECVILNLQEGRGQYDDMTDLSARFTFRWEAPQGPHGGAPVIIHDLECHHAPYDDVIEQRLADDILGRPGGSQDDPIDPVPKQACSHDSPEKLTFSAREGCRPAHSLPASSIEVRRVSRVHGRGGTRRRWDAVPPSHACRCSR